MARAFLCAPQQGAKRTSTPTSVRGWLANWLSQANVKKYNVHTHSITFWLSCYGYTMVFRLTLSATPYESCDRAGSQYTQNDDDVLGAVLRSSTLLHSVTVAA